MEILSGKVVIITGAASGIGAAAARLFAGEGALLMLADVSQEPLAALAAEIGGGTLWQMTDVANEVDVRSLVEATLACHGRIDVALLNAGVAGEALPIENCPVELFDRIMAVNARGVWLGLKHVMKAMSATGGSIVVTASTAGIRATPNMSAYVGSKHASIGLMRAAAVEGASRNIRVNSVNPATVDTPMVQALERHANPPQRAGRSMAAGIPLGRQGTPEEVARMMLFLASDASSFCTGGVYMVDGGVSAGRAN